MGKNQEERKTPVIVVKKRRTFSPPSLSEKTDIIAPVFTEQTAESAPAGINSSAVETHIPEAPARKKKKKNAVSRPPTGPVSILTSAWKNKDPVSSSSC